MSTQEINSTPMDTDSSVQEPLFQRVFEIFTWDNTQSNLNYTRPLSTRTPPAANKNSAFLDMSKVSPNLDGREIAKAIPDGVIGTKFRADTKFIQLFFKEEKEADSFISDRTLDVGIHSIPIIPPKGKLPQSALIKLDNVPIEDKEILDRLLTNALAEFCCPIEIAPITIKGTKLMTSRWEAIVNAIPGKNLSTTLEPILEILGQKVLLSWPGSPATCIQCLSVGHLRKNCPKRTRTAPTPKQGATQTQQKKIHAKTSQTYAGAVVQNTPEQQNPISEEKTETPQKKEYKGPTGLNDQEA